MWGKAFKKMWGKAFIMCLKKRCEGCGKVRNVKWKTVVGTKNGKMIWKRVCWKCKSARMFR